MATGPSEIVISGTTADPVVRARRSLDGRSDELRAELAAKITLATELALSPAERERARDGLVSWCTDHLCAHLAAANQALYAVAAGADTTRLLVRAVRDLQHQVNRHVQALTCTRGTEEFAAAAHELAAVVTAYLHVHTTVFLPALVTLPGADALDFVGDFDTVLAGGYLGEPGVLDVREIPHDGRHPRIFARYARLPAGESFVLVNNHNPKRLRVPRSTCALTSASHNPSASGTDRQPWSRHDNSSLLFGLSTVDPFWT